MSVVRTLISSGLKSRDCYSGERVDSYRTALRTSACGSIREGSLSLAVDVRAGFLLVPLNTVDVVRIRREDLLAQLVRAQLTADVHIVDYLPHRILRVFSID